VLFASCPNVDYNDCLRCCSLLAFASFHPSVSVSVSVSVSLSVSLSLSLSLSLVLLVNVGNIVSGTDEQTQTIMHAGVLGMLSLLLNHPKVAIRRETAWTLSNITAGSFCSFYDASSSSYY
jgi:hypothetical protein